MKSPVLIIWSTGITMTTDQRRRGYGDRVNDSAHASTSSSLPENNNDNDVDNDVHGVHQHVELQSQQQPQQQSSSQQQPEVKSGIHHVTVVVMGASGVGKTAMLRQFVYNEFSDVYRRTRLRDYHYVTLVVNERIYEVKLVDCSQVSRFPASSLQEWSDYRGFCLRNASAYLLVYDVTSDESFRYVRSMYDQITKSRNTHDVPIIVVANKLDLLSSYNHSSSSHHPHHHQNYQQQLHHHQRHGAGGGYHGHHQHHNKRRHHHRTARHCVVAGNGGAAGGSGGGGGGHGFIGANAQDGFASCCHGGGSHSNGDALSAATGGDRQPRLNRQEQANLVKKQMKCGFMECSAMLNWRITAVFRELMKSLDQAKFGHSSRVQDAFRNQRCSVS